MSWKPDLPEAEGPRYLRLVQALERDVEAGRLGRGQRLPTHRELAGLLGLSVGTVSKAYATAERRGLVSGEVGRGTFVLGRASGAGRRDSPEARRANLALNAPPPTGEDALLAEALREVAAAEGFASLLGYLPHQGRADHRAAVARWMALHGLDADPSSVFVTHGAQHAISIALRLIAPPGSVILAESLTYSGLITLAQLDGYALRGVAMDRHGLTPEALDGAFRETGARALYCTPTLQAATAAILPEDRRAEIAEVVRRHDAYIVEDDAWGFLCPAPPAPLSALAPERSFYVVSFAKCLAPGLRIGAMTTPPAFRDRAVNAIRSTGWMANPLMAEAVGRMILDGRLDAQVARKREAARRRRDVARAALGDVLEAHCDTPAFHAWMTVPPGRTLNGLLAQAAQAGVTLAAPSALPSSSGPTSVGLRICFGGPATEAELTGALDAVRVILEEAETMALL